jgi:multicomponent K+:H+ antiporter subunit A
VGFAAVLVLGSLTTALMHRQRLVAVIALGITGAANALLFLEFSAPDLALTQLSVEFATAILVLMALFHLPVQVQRERLRLRVWFDVGIAVLAGLIVAGLALYVAEGAERTVAEFYLGASKPHGGGSNVVNVILVDFRGFDTLGEVTVLIIAALGVAKMTERLELPRANRSFDGLPWTRDPHPLMFAMVSRPLLPLLLMVAVFLFLRGHNDPGGGFIAGLVTAIALILQFLASGVEWARARISLDFTTVAILGVGLAFLTGFGSIILGKPFLTSATGHVQVPGFGEVELASAMAFDLGVYAAVVGAVSIILLKLGTLSHPDLPESSEEPR